MSHLVATEYKYFEDIRRTRSDGSEYWYARELASVLDYAKWENFAKVIKRAMIACENMMEVLEEMDVDVERLRPQGKDWNDDLCAKRGGHG